MRKTALAVPALAVAVVLQLTVLNGLRLAGGGVPDLVLVLVAALALTDGPVRGMVTGFGAGLVLDLAPPGSAVLGEYTLVFCLVGWAGGKLSRLAAKSSLQCMVLLAVVVAAGEALAAALSLALDPAQVSATQIRQVLPSSIADDLLAIPVLLVVVLLATHWAAQERAGTLEEAGARAAQSASAIRRPSRRSQPREPQLAPAGIRPHDGWVGSKPAGLAGRPGAQRRPTTPHGLRPADGVAGSARTGPARHPGLAAPPVKLRLSGGRRGDGAVGDALRGHAGLPRRRPASATFRPHSGVPGGSAAGQFAALLRPEPSRPGGGRPASVRFGVRRGDATVGRLLGRHASAAGGLAGVDHSGRAPAGIRPGRTTRLRFGGSSLAAPRSPRKAAPRFRRVSGSSASAGQLTGGPLDPAAVMSARRRRAGPPRLRLAAGRRGDGALGGSVLGVLMVGHQRRGLLRPATPRFRAGPLASRDTRGAGKRPRFGYGRHSVLSFLTGRRIGGSWLISRRAGTRSGGFLIGRRAGGVR